MTAAVDVVRRHPRHLVLFALTTGLLLGPVAPAAALVAAAFAAWLAGRLPLAVVAGVAVLAGATLAQARIDALSSGELPATVGRSIDTRAILLEPIRVRRNGSAVARVRLVGRAELRGAPPAADSAAGGSAAASAGSVVQTDDLAGEIAVARAADGRLPPGVRVGSELRLRGSVAPLGDFDAYQRLRGALTAIEVASWEIGRA